MAFPPVGNSDHVVVSVSIDVPINSKQDALFHHIACDYSCADWDGPCDHLRDVPWEDIFKLCISAAASDPWFSAASAAVIVPRNHFFVCTNKINLLNLK